MHVEIFDEENEIDLKEEVNAYLRQVPEEDVVDIKYQIATLYDGRSQIYCFSCMIIIKY